MSNNQGVMSRWMQESASALQQLRRERERHERALEAAMDAIRLHTQAIESLEQDIEVIETAVACTSEGGNAEVTEIEEEFEVAPPTQVHYVGHARPPSPPPLRPVPMHAVGE